MEDKLLNEELSRSNGPRRWPVKLFECCAYRDIRVIPSSIAKSFIFGSTYLRVDLYRAIGGGAQTSVPRRYAGKTYN